MAHHASRRVGRASTGGAARSGTPAAFAIGVGGFATKAIVTSRPLGPKNVFRVNQSIRLAG